MSIGPSYAQTPTTSALNMLVLGVDVNGQGYPIVMIDMAHGTADTLATFASRPVCQPSLTPDGQMLLYELYDESGLPYVYQINISQRERVLLEIHDQSFLNCPLISSDANAIAWHQPTSDGKTALVLTDMQGKNLKTLQIHSTILDMQWTPSGGAMVYQVVDEQALFSELVSLPREGGAMPRVVFQSNNGILIDYMWTSDSTGLLVAYATDQDVSIALLPTPCVIGPGPQCVPEPLASFPAGADIKFFNAYAPLSRQVVLAVQLESFESGSYYTDLWLLDLANAGKVRQITNSAELIESDAVWSPDETTLYFIGSQLDETSQTLRGGIYMLDMTAINPSPILVFQSAVFSPSSFLHVYTLPLQG
ncbi:MAG: hypothetical protein CUN55_01140 [Phototrophicales bacterium]|nr:MAG: hypothetical protein CUN55_01140 [Phototrophicales bacterium]